ncbi:hybrid sensor histidine kinase/response regulator [Azospirillum thermophilum]|uniref:histidine kinase n=1 Tax=Azospirillum thermophilum TaxID=2202148 RepID=A0A2S2CSV6_9PROT|nr:ATP-binding protein [Azospirillum thermophilum]AWK87549.1 hypothetical protein DEW08_16175 [Azospirillum thermophilum]
MRLEPKKRPGSMGRDDRHAPPCSPSADWPPPYGLLDSLGVAAFVLDGFGTIMHANMPAERLIGLPRDGLAGCPLLDFAPALVDAADLCRLRAGLVVAASGARQTIEARGRGGGYDLTLAPLPDGGGVMVTAVDAGPRLRAEARAGEAERLEQALRDAKCEAERALKAKTRFLAAASHDLRQPAQALTLFGAILTERLQGHPQLPMVLRMTEAVEALRGLLDGLLDVARLDAGVVVPKPEPFPLCDLLTRLQADYAPIAEAKGLRLRVRAPRVWLRSDEALLERVLRNLLDNALKYTDRGGVLLAARRRGGALRIDVLDTGVGLPADQMDEIFEEFVQLGNQERDRSRGFGLGLAVVKRLSRLLDLPVSVRSRPDRGACFSVTVPMQGAPAPEEAGRGDAAAASAGGLVVLIDDDPMVLQSMGLVLEMWDWTVLPAATSDEAVEAVRSAGRRPDVIIADYRLRNGCTGVQAIHALAAAMGAAVPAILLTGDTSPERIREARESGFVMLHKPVTVGDLSAALAEARRSAAP